MRVRPVAALHQTFYGVLLVIGGKMGISHCHLDRPVAHELSDGAQINSSHHKSRGEGMPIAMPGVFLDPRRLNRRFKPVPGASQLFSLSFG